MKLRSSVIYRKYAKNAECRKESHGFMFLCVFASLR